MHRLLVPLMFLIVIGGGAFFVYNFWMQRTSSPSTASPNQITQLTNQVMNLQTQVNGLKTSIADLNPISTQSAIGTATDAKFKSIQASILNLQTRVRNLENQGPVKLAQSGSKSPLYIPIGASGSTTATDWDTLATPQISIDPADYQGYSSMQLIMSLKVDQGNGQAFARLVDNNENLAIANSDVTSKNQDFSYVESQAFRLPEGQKLYRIALKTNTGYTASFIDAKIRVNF